MLSFGNFIFISIMGIERFFSGLTENKAISNDKFIGNTSNKINGNHILFDSNSILYGIKGSVISGINKILYFLIKNENTEIIFPSKIKSIISFLDIKFPNIEKQTPQQFNSFFTTDILDSIMIDKCIEYIINLLKKYFVQENIKTIYFTFDGIPSKAKMVTQRKRRFIGSAMEELKTKVFEKYEKELSKNKIRYAYEKLKVDWKTNNITPGTIFMKKLSDILTSNNFINKIKSTCPNLIDYTFSGSMTPGEGEYKIVNYLRSKKFINMSSLNDTHIFYSPDADAIILGLILGTTVGLQYSNDAELNTKISNFTIFRQNQQTNGYDTINVDILSSSIYKHVQQLNTSSINTNKDNIISDIVLLLTVFGNDFLPKIESLNVNQHFMTIINEYSNILFSSTPIKYLIYYDIQEKKRLLNFGVFKKIIFQLKKNESKNLQTTYIRNNYYNFKQLKKIFKTNDDNFISDVNEFLMQLREMNYSIRTEKKISEKYNNKKFKKQLLSILKWRHVQENKVFEKYMEYYLSNGKFPRTFIALIKYSSTSNNPLHLMNIEKKLNNIDQQLKITDYDKELYQLEFMLDDYINKLNYERIQLGQVSIDENKLMLRIQKTSDGVCKYYKDFFGIDYTNKKDISKLCDDYLVGIIWVFNYYFNDFSEKYHYENGDTYFYEHEHSPLLTQIYEHVEKLDDKYPEKVLSDLIKHKIPRNNYFNCVEQLLYVSPENILMSVAPPEYIDFIKSDPFYKKIKPLVNKIWSNSPEIPTIIDCRGVFYVSSCHLKIVYDMIDKSDDVKFLKRLRAIKTTEKTKELSKTVGYNEVFSTSTKTGGNNDEQFNTFMAHTCNILKTRYEKINNPMSKDIVSQINMLIN